MPATERSRGGAAPGQARAGQSGCSDGPERLSLPRGNSASTASESLGQASAAQSPNSRSVRQPSATPGSGSTQRNVPLRPKWPNVRAELRRARPVRRLRRRGARSRGPSRSAPAGRSPGRTPTRPGNCDRGRLGERLGARRASARAARARARAGRRASRGGPSRTAVVARAEPERLEHRPAEVVGEGHLRALRERGAEHVEAVIGVDPPLARPRDRARALERQAGGVGEQVPERRAGRPGRLVEVDRPLLGGDEAGERGDRLRHRGPAVLAAAVAVSRRPCPPRDDDAGGDVLGRPALDGSQSVHCAGY